MFLKQILNETFECAYQISNIVSSATIILVHRYLIDNSILDSCVNPLRAAVSPVLGTIT